MNVKVENLEKNMAKITVEVDYAEFKSAVTKAYNNQKNSISIPGFRKGKVPQAMIEKMYGPEIFFEEAANITINDTYPNAYDESKLDIVSQPEIEVVQIGKDQNFIYAATVAVKPEVKLGKYKGVSVSKQDETVTDEDIEKAIEQELSRSGRTVDTDVIKDGDTAVIDFDGYKDGVAFDGGKAEDYSLAIGSHSFIEGFEEQLIGHKVGDEFDIDVTFPEDYQSEELAGCPAVFKIKIKSATTKELPLLDEEFAEDAGFDSVDDYKNSIKERLEKNKANAAKSAKTEEAMDAIIEDSEMEIPDAMLNTQIDRMIRQFSGQLAQSGLSMDQYMQFSGVTADGLREQVKPEALKQIQTSLILEAVAAAEKIEATDADVDAEIAEMAKAYGMEMDKLKEAVTEEEIDAMKKDLAIRKAADFIADNTKVKATRKKAAKAEASEEE